MKKPATDNKRAALTAKALSVLLAVLLWEAAAAAVGNHILISSPISVLKRFFTIWHDTGFWSALLFSSVRIIGGFFIALSTGFLLGLAAGHHPLIETLLWPYAAIIRSVPVASFIIIALIWLRGSQLSIFISFLMVFPIVYSNILEGTKHADRQLLEAAAVFRVPYLRRLKYIELPQLKPYLISACKVGSGIAWKAGIAAELIGIASGSIGEQLYESKIYFMTEELFVWTIVIVLLSIFFEKLLRFALDSFYRHLTEFRPERIHFPKQTAVLPDFSPDMSVSKGCGGFTDVSASAAHGSKETARSVPNPLAGTSDSSGSAPVSPGIRIRDLSKSYADQQVLMHLDFSVSFGEVVCIMGPSGCGKTTLLRLIAGLETADSGNLDFPCMSSAADSAKKPPLSLVFQEDRLLKEFSLIDNLRFTAGHTASEAVISEHLKELGLEAASELPVNRLSGGMKRRAAIARAMLFPSSIILMDEAFNGLDEETRRLTARYILRRRDGRTLLFITHHDDEAKLLGGRIFDFSPD